MAPVIEYPASNREHRESLLDQAKLLYSFDKESSPDELSQSDGGSEITDGNDRDNISKDEVRGPDNLSSRVNILYEKLQNNLSKFKSILESWLQQVDVLGNEVSSIIMESQDLKSLPPNDKLEDKLREMGKDISSLKLNMPALHNLLKATLSTPGLPKSATDATSSEMLAKLQTQFDNKMRASPTIQGVQQLYYSLDDTKRKCLLCLTAFPEDAIIKKRVLINWWVGEEFLVPNSDSSMATEEAAEKIFEELGKKGFIMLVHKKRNQRSPVPDSCQLHPFVRRVLITLAKEANFLDFDSEGNATAKYSECSRACLVAGGQFSRPSIASGEGKLVTLFNTNEQFLDLKLDSFHRCKVLHLGRWVVSPENNINVNDAPSLLKGMSTMKSLRYLSLQGVTKIGKLPASICKLSILTILDLGACQSLETLPREIGSLQELTYLDFSECYMISHMPKSLANLGKLQVLKGFVLYHDANHFDNTENREEACTLSDLTGMQKLWKLSLRVDKAADLGDEHIQDLKKFLKLSTLTITWIQASKKPSSSHRRTESNSKRCMKYFKKSNKPKDRSVDSPPRCGLMKLDLRGYPRPSMPNWLASPEFKILNKLYIRGGKLANLNWDSQSNNPWPVKILRLKFLADCEIEWLNLRDHFRSLVYLEKFQCPKLQFFPCDAYGVWMKPHSEEEE